MNKRLFLAIPLPSEVKNELTNCQSSWRLPNLKNTEPENLHITVYFLGEISEELISQLSANLLAAYQKVLPFVLFFDKILLAPPYRPPNMIWASFQNNAAFTELVKKTFWAVKDFLAFSDNKKITPHITLARFKGNGLLDKINLRQPQIDKLFVSQILLMESELFSNGPVYQKIETFCLQ